MLATEAAGSALIAANGIPDKVNAASLGAKTVNTLFLSETAAIIPAFVTAASILFSTVQASTLVFVIFYGLDWIATVPPTVMLCRQVLGPEKGAVIYGWVFAAHQIGGSIAAFGAAVLRIKFGDYAAAFYITGILCVITSYFVLQITLKEKVNN